MPSTPTSVGVSIGRSLDLMAKNIKQATRDVAKDAAKIAREEARAEAAAGTGGDRRLSNFKGPGFDVSVKYDQDGVTIKPKGPWKILEEGAAPHGGHPGTAGTQGKRRWSKGRDATLDRLDKSVPKSFDAAMDAGFRAG